jgi:hypothetical protein
MSVNKTLAWTLLLTFPLQTLPAFARQPQKSAVKAPAFDPEKALVERAESLRIPVDRFAQICLDGEGNPLPAAAMDAAIVDNDEDPVYCQAEARRLGQALLDIETEKAKLAGIEPDTSPKTSNEQCVNCEERRPVGLSATEASTSVTADLPPLIASQVKSIEDNGPSCSSDKRKELAEQNCAGAVACNVLRSVVVTIPLMAAQTALAKAFKEESTKSNKCAGIDQASCLTEFVAGVMKNLWFNITGLWDLAQLAGQGVKAGASYVGKKVVSGWKGLWGIEDKSSESLHAASQTTPEQVSKFWTHPLEFMSEKTAELASAFWSFTLESFGCKEWEGLPHASRCKEPLPAWQCATCEQKLNLSCGMLGLAGAEVVSAYLTGGATTLGKSGLKTAAAVTAKAGKALKAAMPILEVVEKIGATGVKVAKGISSVTVKGVEAVTRTRSAQALIGWTKSGAIGAAKMGKKLADARATKIVVKSAKRVAYDGVKIKGKYYHPVRAYVEATEAAFKLGQKHADSAMKAIGKRAVATQGSHLAIPVSDDEVGEFHFVLDSEVTPAEMQLHEVEESIKANGMKYKETELADGGKAIEIENPLEGCAKVTIDIPGIKK